MKDIEKILKNLEEIMQVLEVYKNNDIHIPAPQEETPDIRHFHITDMSDIIGYGRYSKYPLFVKDGNSSHRLIINYPIMEKFIYRDDVEISISFALKGDGICGGAAAVFKPGEVTVHVGGTTLTGKKEDGTIVEIRAGHWAKLHSAHVTVKKKMI